MARNAGPKTWHVSRPFWLNKSHNSLNKNMQMSLDPYEGSTLYYETHVSKVEAISQTLACVKTSGT